MKNFLVTGIPRSGTSLFLSLIDGGQRLCFSEPPWLKDIRESSPNGNALAKNLKIKIEELRSKIANNLPIEMVYKNNTNNVPDNYFSRDKDVINKTREIKKVQFHSKYSEYAFIIKANALFTANMKELLAQDYWNIIPIVRDPLAVIMSWRSVKIASSSGRVKVVEKYSDDLKAIGNQKPLLKRQVLLLDWYFEQFKIFKKSEIIFYEDLIKNPQAQVFKYFDTVIANKLNLSSKNNNQFYDRSEKTKITQALGHYGKFLKEYYPKYN